MNEEENARMNEIHQEYELMGVTSKWVDEYARMLASYPDPATDAPTHDGRFLMLPEGTMPCDLYIEKLTRLTESMEKAEEHAAVAKRFKPSDDPTQPDYISRFGKAAYDQEMTREAEMRKQQLRKPKELDHELRTHLTKFKPIDVKAFHDKVQSLIKEENRIWTNIRIKEATNMTHYAQLQLPPSIPF
jgi:hypothetical protein